MHRSRARLTVGLLFTLIALGGCAAAGPSAPPDSAGASPSAGHVGGTARHELDGPHGRWQ